MRALLVAACAAAGVAAGAPLGVVTTLAGSCHNQDVSLDCVGGYADGVGPEARFSSPYGVGVSPDGSLLFVADQDNNALRVISIASGLVKLFGGGGPPGFADGGSASFSHPPGVSIGADETLYVSDMDNHSIRKVLAAGNTTTLAGCGKAGWADGVGDQALFNLPTSVAAGARSLYVADYANQRIRRVALDSGLVDTLAGSCGAKGERATAGAADDCPGGYADGLGSLALFSLPSGVALSADGETLFVTEERGNRVRAIRLSDGLVSTLAGSGAAGYADGSGKLAAFSSPTGLAASPDGAMLYVADALNMRVRSVRIADGLVGTLAGGAPGFADGVGEKAAFFLPVGVAVSADGETVFVADSGNEAVRRIE